MGLVPADRLEGISPEGLATTVPLANVGSRAIAGCVDLAVQGILIWLIVLATGDGTIAAAVRAILIFSVIFFVPIGFELLDNGRGPGKRLVGLRVLTIRGGPVGFRASAVRNLLRIVDFLPSAYLMGMIAILGTNTGQRLGDVAAGTVVSFAPGRERRSKRQKRKAAQVKMQGAPWAVHQQIAAAERGDDLTVYAVDAVQITPVEIGLVHSYLARRDQLPVDARARLSGDIAARLRPKVMGIAADVSDDEFLETLAAAKSVRR